MLSFTDRESLTDQLPTGIDPKLHKLLTDSIENYTQAGLLDLTYILVVEAGDTEQDIIKNVGFSPLTNPIDGCRYHEEGFIPHWDWLRLHDGWFEMICTVGNSGFAFILFIQDDEGLEPSLRSLCHAHVSNTRS